MTHRDIDAIKERIRSARVEAKPKRKYRKSRLSQKMKAELCLKLVEADVALKDANLNRDAVLWHVYKSGLPMSLIAESLGVSEGTVYSRVVNLRKAFKTK